MQILFITPQVPYPPRQGTTIRNYNLIRYLAERHTIDLLTFTAPNEKLDVTNPLHEHCRKIASVQQPFRTTRKRIMDTFLSPLPDMGHRLESAKMRELVDSWLNEVTFDEWDIVQIEGIEVAQYGFQILDGLRQRFPSQTHSLPKLVFDDHNCEYLLQKRNALNDLFVPKRWVGGIYSVLQWQKLRRYERQICLDTDATFAVSVADKESLREIAPAAEISVIINGFDPPADSHINGTKKTNDAKTLLYIGKMDYRPNVDAMLWFGREIFPLIRAEIGEVSLKIVGMNPHPRLNELAIIEGISIVGMVENLAPYIEEASVYVIPLRVGGGTRFKALEAMAYRKAIVATSLGVEGIPVQHERELLLADSAEDFASSTIRLLSDQAAGGKLSNVLGENALRVVESTFTWQAIIPEVERVHSRLL